MIEKDENIIKNCAGTLGDFYADSDIFHSTDDGIHPSRDDIISILLDLRKIVFPGYFCGGEYNCAESYKTFAEKLLCDVCHRLSEQVKIAMRFENDGEYSEEQIDEKSDDVCRVLCSELPSIQQKLEKDVKATFNGDPAAKNTDEIIISYPGILAIFTYRIAHVFYKENVPLIPRIMTEYAHSRTGIDINAGAEIGENFVIDHGTGIVIGETTEIGNNVKLYQGVTLGALSTRKGQELSGVKRHPTICDNVTIYSGSTILGGKTVIGEGAIIGGNAFITQSVLPKTKVIVKPSEHIFKTDETNVEIGLWEI